VLQAPDFTPERAPWLTAVAIGSGAHIAEYAAEVEAMSRERGNLLAFDNEVWNPMGGPLIVLSAVLADRIRKVGAPGISPHLVLCSIQWGRVSFGTNEGVGFEDAHRAERWPRIARNLQEWQALKKAHHLANLVAEA